MNRVTRAGLMVLGVMCVTGMAAWLLGGSGKYDGYGGSGEYYPVTVRMWLDDAFIGGIQPVGITTPHEGIILEMLAAGNDLIYVDEQSPRCAVWSVAWVRPAPNTQPDARVYNATIRCSGPDVSPPTPLTVESLLREVGP